VNAGDSQTTIAKQLGMNLTTVAHHLSLLELPPELDEAMKAGRCTSPRTLHELRKLHERQPEQVKALVDGPGDITREAVATLRERVDSRAVSPLTRLVSQAVTACDRLEKLLGRIDLSALGAADLAVLRAKVAALSSWSPQGSDRQTP
jgi:ParB family chromosome partitioning protein